MQSGLLGGKVRRFGNPVLVSEVQPKVVVGGKRAIANLVCAWKTSRSLCCSARKDEEGWSNQ
jgi:hypothetical protein